MYDNLGQVFQSAGVKNLAGLSNPRRYFYAYPINFDSDIAAGGSDEASIKTDGNSVFIVDQIAFTAWIPSASGAAIAGTPLVRSGGDTLVANNTFAGLDHLRLNLRTDETQWFSSSNGLRASLIVGVGQQPAYPLTKPIISGNRTIYCTLYNDSAETIRAQLALIGQKWIT